MQMYFRKRDPGYEKRMATVARIQDRIDRQSIIVAHRKESVELLLYNARRGMSRQRMCQIWGDDFVRVILDGV